MEGSGCKPPPKRSKGKASWYRIEGIYKKKKPAELYVRVTVISCERSYSILTEVTNSTVFVEAGAPHYSRSLWNFSTTHISKATESVYWY